MMNDMPPRQTRENPRALDYGFTQADLVLDQATIDRSEDLSWAELMTELIDSEYVRHDPYAADRTLHHALMLFIKLSNSPAFYDQFPTDTFSECLDTAMIWECG